MKLMGYELTIIAVKSSAVLWAGKNVLSDTSGVNGVLTLNLHCRLIVGVVTTLVQYYDDKGMHCLID